MPPPGCGGVRSLYVIIRFPLTIEPHGEFAAASPRPKLRGKPAHHHPGQ
jgi:hypothetical protein